MTKNADLILPMVWEVTLEDNTTTEIVAYDFVPIALSYYKTVAS